MALDLSFFSLFMLLAKEYMMLVVVIFSTVLPAKKILSLTIRLCWFITQLLQHRSVGGGSSMVVKWSWQTRRSYCRRPLGSFMAA